MAALTRKDNIPFIMKNTDKARRAFYSTPSKKEVERVKGIAKLFDEIDVKKTNEDRKDLNTSR